MYEHPMYVTTQEAIEQLYNRQARRAEIESWWNDRGLPELPEELNNSAPIAIIALHVATARYEDIVFNTLTRRAGFTPVWAELTADSFSDKSDFKRSLIHRRICDGHGRNGGVKLRRENFLDKLPANGVSLRDIGRSNGETLLEYHHAIQDRFLPNARRCDISDWLYAAGKNAKGYYPVALSLYLAHCVLFDDFHGGEGGGSKLNTFTQKVFNPARAYLINKFGLAPLIVRLPWQTEFAYYPGNDDISSHKVIPDDLL